MAEISTNSQIDTTMEYHATSNSQYFSALLIAPPGCGKTTMALTAPKPIHVLDVDGKMFIDPKDPKRHGVTFSRYGAPKAKMKSKIRIYAAPNANDASSGFDPSSNPRIFQELVDELNGYLTMVDEGTPLPFETLVLDTVSRLSEHLELLIMKLQGHGVMTISDWKPFKNSFLSLLEGFLQLPCNRIMCVHSLTYVDEITKETKIVPAIAGQTSELISGYFQEVYYLIPNLEAGKMSVTARTRSDRKYQLSSYLTDLITVPADFERILRGDFRGEAAKAYVEAQKATVPKAPVGKIQGLGGVK